MRPSKVYPFGAKYWYALGNSLFLEVLNEYETAIQQFLERTFSLAIFHEILIGPQFAIHFEETTENMKFGKPEMLHNIRMND